MKSILLAACLALATPECIAQAVPVQSAKQVSAGAEREIGAVIELFRTAIIDKDKARFMNLFPEGGTVAWQDVTGDANLHALRKARPQAKKVDVDPDGNNHVAFIDGIVAQGERTEETFDNISIDTDGDIASVTFDYRFLSDGRETNRGKEAWHLVRTDAGWKIVSVIWSTNRAIEPDGNAQS